MRHSNCCAQAHLACCWCWSQGSSSARAGPYKGICSTHTQQHDMCAASHAVQIVLLPGTPGIEPVSKLAMVSPACSHRVSCDRFDCNHQAGCKSSYRQGTFGFIAAIQVTVCLQKAAVIRLQSNSYSPTATFQQLEPPAYHIAALERLCLRPPSFKRSLRAENLHSNQHRPIVVTIQAASRYNCCRLFLRQG